MAKKTKKARSVREELRAKTVVGLDKEERNLLDLFTEDDFFESKDKKDIFVRHDALLRVAKTTFGIRSRESWVKSAPNHNNNWCAVVKVKYVFDNKREFTALADCRQDSANPGFKRYTTALAETRASARALRSAIGLEMVTQEEVTDIEDLIERSDEEPATELQKSLIIRIMKKKDKTPKDVGEVLDKKVRTLDELTQGEAKDVLAALNTQS
jgi:hypothetical protein